jgi:hypothetical protein
MGTRTCGGASLDHGIRGFDEQAVNESTTRMLRILIPVMVTHRITARKILRRFFTGSRRPQHSNYPFIISSLLMRVDFPLFLFVNG